MTTFKYFWKNNLTTQQIDEIYSGQPFAILQSFLDAQASQEKMIEPD